MRHLCSCKRARYVAVFRLRRTLAASPLLYRTLERWDVALTTSWGGLALEVGAPSGFYFASPSRLLHSSNWAFS
ncbi:MAG: hypothetical protein QXI07_07585 [Pyrobaculum sp.]